MTNKLSPAEIMIALGEGKILESFNYLFRLQGVGVEVRKIDFGEWESCSTPLPELLLTTFRIYEPPKKLSEKFKEDFGFINIMYSNEIYEWLLVQENDNA